MSQPTKSGFFLIVSILIVAAGTCIRAQERSTLPGQPSGTLFKGKVHDLSRENLPLDQKMALAHRESKKAKQGAFLTGYAFLSRYTIHQGDCTTPQTYKISRRNSRIIRHKADTTRRGDSFSTREGSETVGLIFLHEGASGKFIDAELIDLDNTYTFEEVPLYWFGQADNEESLRILEKAFDSGNENLQKTLVFCISAYDSPRPYEFLRDTARGECSLEVRKSAIFWLGNYKDSRSLQDLKALFKGEKNTKLSEQVVFAIQMNDQPEAVRELIHIAKTAENHKTRKTAVFWLGQKASEECVTALKDVVEEAAEEVEVKKSAVFAISQLPKDKAVPTLIEIAKTNKSPAVRKNAIFWLGQVDDERALRFFEEILLKR